MNTEEKKAMLNLLNTVLVQDVERLEEEGRFRELYMIVKKINELTMELYGKN